MRPAFTSVPDQRSCCCQRLLLRRWPPALPMNHLVVNTASHSAIGSTFTTSSSTSSRPGSKHVSSAAHAQQHDTWPQPSDGDLQDFQMTGSKDVSTGLTNASTEPLTILTSSSTEGQAACPTSNGPGGLSVSAGGSKSNKNDRQARWQQAKASTSAFIINNFMLLSFSLAAALAMAWPLPGRVVASWSVGDVRVVQAINNFLVFLISGLTLKSDDFRALLKHWVGVLYGLAAILLFTPCFAFLMMLIPLQPREFATGLALFCVVPTTLGVGVALTAASKGNQALALLLTVATNLLGIVTVPYELKLVLSTTSASTVVSVDPQNLVVKLLLTVLVPAVIGKLARDFSSTVCSFVTKHKTALSLFSTLNLAAIVWQTLSGARDTLLQQAFTSVLLVIVLSSGLHLVMLALNVLVVRYLLRLPFREGVAVMIMSSQKSAPVAVTVISYLTPNLTQQGLMAIPCILGQLAQIFIGSALARYLRGIANKQS